MDARNWYSDATEWPVMEGSGEYVLFNPHIPKDSCNRHVAITIPGEITKIVVTPSRQESH